MKITKNLRCHNLFVSCQIDWIIVTQEWCRNRKISARIQAPGVYVFLGCGTNKSHSGSKEKTGEHFIISHNVNILRDKAAQLVGAVEYTNGISAEK